MTGTLLVVLGAAITKLRFSASFCPDAESEAEIKHKETKNKIFFKRFSSFRVPNSESFVKNAEMGLEYQHDNYRT